MTALAAVVFSLLLPHANFDNKNDEATKIAVKLTTDGAALFNKKDAKGLAETYVEDGVITMYSKDKDNGSLKLETTIGRAEIEKGYEKLWKDRDTINSKNTVEHARLHGDFLIITGEFDPDLGVDVKVGFTQVRFKQDGKWLITSMQLFLESK